MDEFLLNTASESAVVSEIRNYHPFFRKLTYQSSAAIFQQSSIVCLKPSQVLFKEGESEYNLHIILCGRIIIYANDQDTLGIVAPGESVGEEAFISSDYSFR